MNHLYILLLLCAGCKSSSVLVNPKSETNPIVKDGVILMDYYMKYEDATDFFEDRYPTTSRILFSDSLVIFELKGLEIHEDPYGNTTTKRLSLGYIYHDFKSQAYYTYRTFSDTALLQSAFTQPDTAFLTGTWNFKRGNQPSLTEYLELSEFKDTLVQADKSSFMNEGRFKVAYGKHKDFDLDSRLSYIFLQKDSIPLHFTYEQALSKKYGLPLTRYDWPTIGLNGKKLYMSQRIFLERAYLTSEEIKVFKAWAEYAKNNPVE